MNIDLPVWLEDLYIEVLKITWSEPLWLALLLVVPVILCMNKLGYLGYSDNRLLEKSLLWLRALCKLPAFFLIPCLVLTSLAITRPQVPGEPVPLTIPGRDVILAVDISYSMSFAWKGELPKHETPKELDFKGEIKERRRENRGMQMEVPTEKLQRIHATQNALLRFIENRWRGKTGDRIGLIVFDVAPRYGWPITDDLRMLYRKAQFLQSNLGTGTNFGKNPPGPIDLAAEHFRESGQAKSRVLILVTDGEDSIDEVTKRRLMKILAENNIRLYLVGIGETLAKKDVGIIQLTNEYGGHIFRVEDTNSLNRCFETIDRLEKSEVTSSQLETRNDVFFYYAWPAAIFLGLFLLSELFILTR